MNLESLTNIIVKLCEECNVWSSTINIPLGNGDFLDISSAASGAKSSTPEGAEIYPEQCPKTNRGSYYTFDHSVYDENSRPALKFMLMSPGCVSGCKLVLRISKGPSYLRKATHYLWCSCGLVMKDKSKSVYDGNNVGKSNVKKEHMKRPRDGISG